MRSPLEKDVQSAILQYLRLRGAFVLRVNSGAFAGEYKGRRRFVRFNSEPGCSDILGILADGRFLACEVKRPGWKLRAADHHEQEQASFLEAVRKRGGVGIFATCIEDVERAIDTTNAGRPAGSER